MFNARTDSLRDEGPLFGERRRGVQAECERLASTIDTLDAELDRIARQRRELAQQLRGHRRRLWPRLAKRARLPGPDGSVQLPPVPRGAVFVRGRRLRRACLVLLARMGSMALIEIHVMLHRFGFAVASSYPVKALADALAYEAEQGRATRVSRGVYEAQPGAPRSLPWPLGAPPFPMVPSD